MSENELSRIILNCCFNIHIVLGPGLLESVYEEALAYELVNRNLLIKKQQAMPVVYKQVRLDLGFRTDLIVEDKVIIESNR